MNNIVIGDRIIGIDYPPLVIAEIGINHEGDYSKLVRMVDDAYDVGCECIKIQTHIVDDEMISNDITPDHCDESIYEIMQRCALTAKEEENIKEYIETKGMLFMSTPFSRAAADRLKSLGVKIYKIGSGECNNYPLIEHIASFGKPIMLLTEYLTSKSLRIFKSSTIFSLETFRSSMLARKSALPCSKPSPMR